MISESTHNHSDAIGYLDDLVNEVNQPWFKMLRDVIILSGVTSMDQETLDKACAIFLGEIDRAPEIVSEGNTSPLPSSISSNDFLEQLSAFSNFKLLRDTLQVDFKRPITLVFGTNGSGKSSLCESFRVLASHGRPNRPIENVRASSSMPTTFAFKFKNDATVQTWTPTYGYGLHSDKIRYFDSTVAYQNISTAVEPGRIVTLTPFKLHLFENLKGLTTQLRDALKDKQTSIETALKQAFIQLRSDCSDFDTSPLASIDINNMDVLANEIARAEIFNQQQELVDKLAAATELEKAISEEGLTLLRSEQRELDIITKSLQAIIISAKTLWDIEPVKRTKTLKSKRIEQQALADALIPEGVSLEKLMPLLRSASGICELDGADGQICPLCKRALEEAQVKLFRQYHDLLTGQLEEEITTLESGIRVANTTIERIKAVNPQDWDELWTLPAEMLASAKTAASLVIANCAMEIEPSLEVKGAFTNLEELVRENIERMKTKGLVIETSTNNRTELVKQLETLRAEIKPLAYCEFLSKKLEDLQKIQQMIDISKSLRISLSAFRPLLTKITNTAKTAYEELVVNDFETRLNTEYRNLTEKEMSAFGVALKRIGTEASVTVVPQISGNGIDGVLSEGELRVHALALFFAELECNCPSVLVFDDPASSFDYDYIGNYSIRVRNFILAHPNSQVIILTHNWEFFVQLQSTFNKARLNDRLSVQVLENCSVVSEYSEKVGELELDVTAILAAPHEPTKKQKEDMASKMRRLIEAVVNTHVFNGQRHQYKQKSQVVSEFDKFTKVTPLLSAEAIELGDLYSKLSITEHDDPRTAYVNTDKATFQSRFDRIKSIESAIVGRK